MPPKKQQTKNDKKKAQKVVEDKTFGMKNKNKSAKAQRYIQQLQSQAKHNAQQNQDKSKSRGVDKKEEDRKRREELAELFKPVQTPQKVPFGTDPKTVLCIYFKQGHCERGAKCKFSHDLNVDRKQQKKDLYTDSRANDTMENWDQKKLEEVINKKSSKQPPTDIVCKYFLEAIESSKYGWFWECPNGGDQCKYRHALPPGFVLKSQEAKKAENKKEISLEEFLESERHKLGSNLTPMTLETFQEWKKNRVAKKDAKEQAERKAKETRMKAGRSQGMSGRDLFEFNPSLAIEEDYDDEAMDLSMYERQDDDDAENQVSQGVQNMSVQDAAPSGSSA
ncbi:hypothetical protein LRAMOSA03715 [Lichtheimia ramosa]|uniref:C3H1-type domain-containing protein n=1 Tax=Lichtheimia ramosa TaxID=688394 RepID=A0A077WXD2_9FUNG|nr:hypothetical protein LRAMOSA03715 [Lichtheimia ramosa]